MDLFPELSSRHIGELSSVMWVGVWVWVWVSLSIVSISLLGFSNVVSQEESTHGTQNNLNNGASENSSGEFWVVSSSSSKSSLSNAGSNEGHEESNEGASSDGVEDDKFISADSIVAVVNWGDPLSVSLVVEVSCQNLGSKVSSVESSTEGVEC